MNIAAKTTLLLLRLGTGWVMFYAGIIKVLDPEWTSLGYLQNAKTFPAFFQWFAQPHILPAVDFLNQWGLTILGVSLILGLLTRISSIWGAVLMMLYYFPILTFPTIGGHSFIVDEHIIYALVLVFFAGIGAGRHYGLDGILLRIPRWLG